MGLWRRASIDFLSPFIAAHLGGWPENLNFLDGLLSRHDNLYLDTSATKWMVRTLSQQEPKDVLAFFDRGNVDCSLVPISLPATRT